MERKLNESSAERIHFTSIVGETKKIIMDEPDHENSTELGHATDVEVKKAVERINPDPNSLKSRG
ncbi:MAG: hypothetical protein LBU57_07720 [Dysgonamonadaceae bacterium]|jgi:hypothetical protein|nr:hypothetical protein [Dysgonamonadaceae bacterium]